MKHTNAYARINLANLKNNFNYVSSLNPDKTPICIVKADAYGHGADKCAEALTEAGAEWFAVASLDEAEALRASGIEKNILILGYVPIDRIDELIKYNLICGIYSKLFAEKLSEEAEKEGKKISVHIKLNTGMNRLGFDCTSSAVEDIKYISTLKGLKLSGIFSHYSTADESDFSYSEMQRTRFCETVAKLKEAGIAPEMIHISNSAAALWFDCDISNAYRPGIVLYGISPLPNEKQGENLKPVMSFMSRVANTFTLKKGCDVGYGRKFTAQKDMHVATVCVGYADGYFRALSNKADVLICGKRARIIGSVCMDMMMVDITDIPEAKVGDEVELFGEHIKVTELSEIANTIPYEIMCAVSKRVKRIYEK